MDSHGVISAPFMLEIPSINATMLGIIIQTITVQLGQEQIGHSPAQEPPQVMTMEFSSGACC